MKVLPSVKARTSDMFVRVRNAVLTRHVERDARPSVRADTRAFRSMALTGPIAEGPRFGVPIPSPAGVSSEVPRSVQRRVGRALGLAREVDHPFAVQSGQLLPGLVSRPGRGSHFSIQRLQQLAELFSLSRSFSRSSIEHSALSPSRSATSALYVSRARRQPSPRRRLDRVRGAGGPPPRRPALARCCRAPGAPGT